MYSFDDFLGIEVNINMLHMCMHVCYMCS